MNAGWLYDVRFRFIVSQITGPYVIRIPLADSPRYLTMPPAEKMKSPLPISPIKNVRCSYGTPFGPGPVVNKASLIIRVLIAYSELSELILYRRVLFNRHRWFNEYVSANWSGSRSLMKRMSYLKRKLAPSRDEDGTLYTTCIHGRCSGLMSFPSENGAVKPR